MKVRRMNRCAALLKATRTDSICVGYGRELEFGEALNCPLNEDVYSLLWLFASFHFLQHSSMALKIP